MADRREREQREGKRMSAKDWADKQEKGGAKIHFKLPDGVEEYKLETGTHRVDFLSFAAGPHNKRADEGFEHYECQYAAHRIEGPDGRKGLFNCRFECFGMPCPACKLRNSRDVDKEVSKSLMPQTRHLWLLNDEPGKTKKVRSKVLDTGHFNRGVGFGELMIDAINICKGDPFALVGGMTAVLTVKEQTAPFGKFNAVTRIDFEQRDYDYPADLWNTMPCLDAMLVDAGIKAMRRLLEQDEEIGDEEERSRRTAPDEEDNDVPSSSRSTRSGRRADPDEDDDEDATAARNGKPTRKGKAEPTATELGIEAGMKVEHAGEVWTVIKVSGDGTSLTLEDAEDNEKRGVGPEEVTLAKKGGKKPVRAAEPDDEDEAPPAKVQGKPGKKRPVAEEDDEDDPDAADDGDEDDEDDPDEDSDLDDEDDEEAKESARKPAKKPARR